MHTFTHIFREPSIAQRLLIICNNDEITQRIPIKLLNVLDVTLFFYKKLSIKKIIAFGYLIIP